MIEINPLGAVLAVVFLGSMGTLFHWMFSLPPVMPQQVVTARRTVRALRRILVPVVQTVPAERAVELAARLGREQKAEIILVYVVEVPLLLPLEAPMPAQEQAGRDALKTAEFLVRQHNLPVRARILPARQAADGILRLAEEEEADAIVVGLGVKHRNVPDELGRTARDLLRRASCEVVLDKAPIKT